MSGGAQNTQPAQGGIPGLLAKAPDPLGLSNGGGGLDPLNLMGSQASAPPPPSVLTNLGARSMQPQRYSASSFVAPKLTGGAYNRMAQQDAGPVYSPTLIRPANHAGPGGNVGPGAGAAGNMMRPGGPGSGIGPLGTPGNMPASYSPMSKEQGPNLDAIRAMLQQARSKMPPNGQPTQPNAPSGKGGLR